MELLQSIQISSEPVILAGVLQLTCSVLSPAVPFIQRRALLAPAWADMFPWRLNSCNRVSKCLFISCFFPQRCLPVIQGSADLRLALCQPGVCQRYTPLHPLSQALGSGTYTHNCRLWCWKKQACLNFELEFLHRTMTLSSRAATWLWGTATPAFP